ncbi:MAG: nSTAND1 domain-containing NTPase, partial [Chthoniobacterales bacterium]
LRLRSHPLLVLYGRSGLGKTSILTAGLLPRLRAEGRNPLLVRLRYEEPSADPMAQLVGALFENAVSPNEWLQQLSAKLELQLPDDPASLLWLRLHYRAEAPAITHLVLDQFEEVFTVGARRPRAEANVRDALAVFLQGLAPETISRLIAEHDRFSDLFDADSVPVRVILALRADFLYALNRWQRHVAALGQNSYELRSLRGTAAFAAVYKPGELRCHYRGEVKEENRIETGLPPIVDEETARRIVRFVANKGADIPIEEIEAVPPILSLLCRELNERRFCNPNQTEAQITFREGDADIGRIISAFYERCLADKPEAVRIFIEEELVSVSGARLAQDEGSILRVFTEGCDIPGAADRHAAGFGDATAARACLHELINERLLNSLGGDVPSYELIHDLIAGVAEKSRTAREQRFEKEEAERRAQTEKIAKEQAQSQARRAHRTAILVSVLLIVAVIAGIVGYGQKRKAEEATARATRARNEAEKLIEFMTFNLRDNLEPIGRLDLLHDVNEHIAAYYSSFAGEDESPDSMRQRGAMLANEGNVALDSGDLAEAEKDYNAFLGISERLCQQNPKRVLWQRDRALAHADLGNVQQSRGDLNGALAHHREALAVLEELVRQVPSDSDVQMDLSRTYFRIGDVLRQKGDQAAAYKNFQDALPIQLELIAKKPDDLGLQRAACSTYDALGDVEMARGNLQAGLDAYRQSFNLRTDLTQKNPGDLSLQLDLSVSDMNIAVVQKQQDDAAAATKNFEEALAIRKRLCEHDPHNAYWLRGLAETFEAIGDVARTHGDLNRALDNFTQGLTRREQLCSRDPNNAAFGWDRSTTLMSIGDIHKDAGRLSEAFNKYNESLEVRRDLLKKNPDNAAGERDICVSYDRLGAVQQDRGNLTEALTNYRQFVAIGEKLVHNDPTNAEFQSTLCYAYGRVGEAIHEQGDYAGALQTFRDILTTRERLAQQNAQNADWKWNIVETQNEMADMFIHQGAAEDALEVLRTGLTSADALLPKDPGNVFHRWDVAILHSFFAQAYSLQNNFEEAGKEAA